MENPSLDLIANIHDFITNSAVRRTCYFYLDRNLEDILKAMRSLFIGNLDESVYYADQIYSNPLMQQAIWLLAHNGKSGHVALSYLRHLVFVMHWAHFGFPVFRVDDNLLTQALLTDAPDIMLDGIPLPFPALRFSIPREFLPIYSGKETHHIDTIDFVKPVLIPKEESPDSVSPEFAWSSPMWVWIADARKDQAAVERVGPDRMVQLETTIGTYHSSMPATRSLSQGMIWLDCECEDDERRTMININRILANLFLMLDARIVQPKRIKRHYPLCFKRNTGRPQDFVLPYKKVVLPLKVVAKEFCKSPNQRQGWKLMVGYCVRGHGQHYWTGKRKKDRIWKHKEAFWKGPQDMKGIVHSYQPKVDNATQT